MHFTTTFLATLAPLALAGKAIVQNACTDPVFLWSVGGSVGERQTIDPGANYTETTHYDDVSGGIALKITRTENGLYDGSPQTNFQYALTDHLYYDLFDVFGDPFSGSTLVVHPSLDTCSSICWDAGVRGLATSQTEACSTDADITLTLCAESC
jgi:hypothetical protein